MSSVAFPPNYHLWSPNTTILRSQPSASQNNASPPDKATVRYFPMSQSKDGQYLQLTAGVNSYDWGKVGSESAAAKFAAATPSDDIKIEQEKPYAEVRTSCETITTP